MAEISSLFLKLSGDFPNEIFGLILRFMDPRDFLLLLTEVVSNMKELKELCCKEHENFNNVN